MAIDAAALRTMIARELDGISDPRVVLHVRKLLIEPMLFLGDWNYGPPGQQYPCWAVLDSGDGRGGIAFSEHGFGPKCPWGLMAFGRDQHRRMGDDSGWYPSFLEAFFESVAATHLAIWRVFKQIGGRFEEPLTEEDTWDATWAKVTQLDESDPAVRHVCWHGIAYTGRRY